MTPLRQSVFLRGQFRNHRIEQLAAIGGGHQLLAVALDQAHGFHAEFAAIHCAPRLSHAQTCEVTVYADSHSLETIADQGLTSITSLVFPDKAWTGMFIRGHLKVGIASLKTKDLPNETKQICNSEKRDISTTI